jgi:hypothetical protein
MNDIFIPFEDFQHGHTDEVRSDGGASAKNTKPLVSVARCLDEKLRAELWAAMEMKDYDNPLSFGDVLETVEIFLVYHQTPL